MSYRPRQKASDVFREANFVFGKKVSFAEAFPQIDNLVIEVEERGHDIWKGGNKKTYGIDYLPGEYINCSNPLCYNGGFSIGEILRDMVNNKKTEMETSEICQGYEGSPKGRRIYRRCHNLFRIKVSMSFK